MRDMSLHILDIAENSINAGAALIELSIEEDRRAGLLKIAVLDNGRGFKEPSAKERDPYFTSKGGKRFGLGIPLLRQSAEMTGGTLELAPRPGGGTSLTASFGLGHIDLKPMGDLGATVSTLVGCHPEIDYVVSCTRVTALEADNYEFRLDTRQLRQELEGLPLSTPAVLGYIKEEINEAIRRAHADQ